MGSFARRRAADAAGNGVTPGVAGLVRGVALVLGIGLVAGFLYLIRPGGLAVYFDRLLASVGVGPSAVALGTVASDRQTIWARLPVQAPECDCHTPPLALLYSKLKDENLDDGLTDEGTIGSWQYMSFSFDSRKVSRQHVENLIATSGGVLLPGRPPTLPTATVSGQP